MKALLGALGIRSSLFGMIALLGSVAACGGEDGSDGAPGADGKDGAMGERGAQGEPGAMGEPGAQGLMGEPGAMGEKGDPGAMGEQGDPGDVGEKGAPGDKGEMGAPGDKGDKGDNGEPGDMGDPGVSPAVGVSLSFLGRYSAGAFDKGAAEIVTFDAKSKRVFVVNASAATVDVLAITDPANPVKLDTIDVADADALRTLGNANSVSARNGILAVAIEAAPKTDPGIVAFYDTETLALLGTAEVGALPDMITFSPDGTKVLVANEGEPSDDYTVDPEGSVSIVMAPIGATAATSQTVSFADFNADVDALRAKGVRVYGPSATVAQDFEPEYVTVAADGKTAWVTLQENNAIAVVDVDTASVLQIMPLGFKNHALIGNELDASDQDGAISIRNWPIFGMYEPDAIASYQVAGKTYLVTANEGDVREWAGYAEPIRLGNAGYVLDPDKFPDAATLKLNGNLGRLNVTKALGDTDKDGDYDQIYSFGARSFSVWTPDGELAFDSGSELELRTAKRNPAFFNSTSTANNFDNRSDDKGPEPEAVTIGYVGGTPFAFIGLERVGGIMVYDLTLPEAPRFVSYVNTRDFTATITTPAAGDLAPEASVFVPAAESPTGKALLVVGNETSGTTAFFEVTALFGAAP